MNDTTAIPAAPVSVTVWGELPGDRKLPGTVLRVLVAGQSAGGVERHESGVWVASWYSGLTRSGSLRDRFTEHATAEDAVRAVVRSAWARRLGARAASRVFWSDRARRTAATAKASAAHTPASGCPAGSASGIGCNS